MNDENTNVQKPAAPVAPVAPTAQQNAEAGAKAEARTAEDKARLDGEAAEAKAKQEAADAEAQATASKEAAEAKAAEDAAVAAKEAAAKTAADAQATADAQASQAAADAGVAAQEAAQAKQDADVKAQEDLRKTSGASENDADDFKVNKPADIRPQSLPLVVEAPEGGWANKAQEAFAKTINGYAYKNPAKYEIKKDVLIDQLRQLKDNPALLIQLTGAQGLGNNVEFTDKMHGDAAKNSLGEE